MTNQIIGGEYDEEHKTIKWKIVNNISHLIIINVEIIKTFELFIKIYQLKEHANIRNVANVKFNKRCARVVGWQIKKRSWNDNRWTICKNYSQ